MKTRIIRTESLCWKLNQTGTTIGKCVDNFTMGCKWPYNRKNKQSGIYNKDMKGLEN